MKIGLKVAFAFVLGFLGGGASGYFFCKSRETKFVVCTDEEQLAYAEADQQKNEPVKTIEEQIDEVFTNKEKEVRESKAVAEINTQKTQYWKQYQDEGGKYDKHSNLEEGEDPVTSDEEFDPNFMNELEDHEEGEVIENLPDIEDSTLQEFYHWNSIPDGEYDTISVCWFAGDEVLVGDDDMEIKNPVRYLGFDPKEAFAEKEKTDEDPDAIYKKNNKYKTIFEVIRYQATYSVKKRLEEFGGGS